MLNYETILSNYDDRLTLLEYLKKVEAALANASAKSFEVEKTGNATIKFVLTFADDTKLESEEIVLQQGESVASAAIAANGHLLLTLTNGDVLDAGNMFNGNVNVTGNVSATGDISASGEVSGDSVTCNDLEVNNSAQVNGDLSVTNDLNAGNITGDSIVENMPGYSAQAIPNANFDFENIYTSAVKNGNKLTLVTAFNLTKLVNTASSTGFVKFIVPVSIANKLYPTTIGGYTCLGVGKAMLWASDNSTAEVKYLILKSGTEITPVLFGADISNMTLNLKYYIRFEITFLLKEGLI